MSETERRGGEFEKGKGKVMDGPGIDHEKLDRGQGIPTAFAGGGAGRRYKECGKVFPDQRLLQLVSLSRDYQRSQGFQGDGTPSIKQSKWQLWENMERVRVL